MKNISEIIFWLIVVVLSVFIITSKIKQSGDKCSTSIENINYILKQTKIIEYED